MKEFKIKLSELQEGYITVDAKNEKEAEKRALKLVEACGFDLLDREIYRRITERNVSLLK